MDLNKFIKENETYVDLLNNQFRVKRRKHLCLIKYDYSRQNFEHSWERLCRGCIIDTTTNKIVCLPPRKAIDYNNDMIIDSTFQCQPLLDGTMINMFYDNETWNLSTRSDIGGNNRWNHMSIKQMIEQCCDYPTLCNSLNKQYCYSFVMNHKSIRNVSNVSENKLTLVEQYDLTTLEPVYTYTDVPCDVISSIPIVTSVQDCINEFLDVSKNDVNQKGITFKKNNVRINVLNPTYLHAKNTLCVNTDNLLYKFIDIQKQKKLNEYVKLFPEHKEKFTHYSKLYDELCSDLLSTYHDLFVNKTIKKKQVKYQLNPLVYELHKHYLQTKQYINKQYVDQYVNNLDTKRLVFTLNYYKL